MAVFLISFHFLGGLLAILDNRTVYCDVTHSLMANFLLSSVYIWMSILMNDWRSPWVRVQITKR